MFDPRFSLPIVAFLVTLAFLVGCSVGESSGSMSYGFTENGVSFQREVKYHVKGIGAISSQGKTATMQFAKGTLVVEEARILLNDQELAIISADAEKIGIHYAGSKLTIVADGQKVYEQ